MLQLNVICTVILESAHRPEYKAPQPQPALHSLKAMSPSQKELALAYSSKLNAQDFDGLASLLSEDFTHEFRPATLGGMGMPFRNKAQFIAHVKEVSHKVVDFNVRPTHLYIVPSLI